MEWLDEVYRNTQRFWTTTTSMQVDCMTGNDRAPRRPSPVTGYSAADGSIAWDDLDVKRTRSHAPPASTEHGYANRYRPASVGSV